jgi:hypothetical protein
VGDEPTFVLGTEVRVNYAHHVLLIYNAWLPSLFLCSAAAWSVLAHLDRNCGSKVTEIKRYHLFLYLLSSAQPIGN